MFIGDLEGTVRIVVLSVLFYFSLIFILKISGKRTLAEINAFDFLVSVVIGSVAATTILSKDTKLTDGLTAVITFVCLQYLISKLDVKTQFITKKFLPDPSLIYYQGEFLDKNMHKMRLTRMDVEQVVRIQTGKSLKEVSAVIFESNGKFSIITDFESDNLNNLIEKLR